MGLLVLFVAVWLVIWALRGLWALLVGEPVPPIIDLSMFRDK